MSSKVRAMYTSSARTDDDILDTLFSDGEANKGSSIEVGSTFVFPPAVLCVESTGFSRDGFMTEVVLHVLPTLTWPSG